jgi:hypothetical protein
MSVENDTIEEIKAEVVVAEAKPKRKYNKKVKVIEPDVVPAEIVEEVKEPETIIPVIVKEEKEKVKKPRSPAQLAAFEKARLKRLENIGKIVTEVKEKMADTQFDNTVVQKAITIKKKQHRVKKLLEATVDEFVEPPVIQKPTFVFA